MKKIFKILSILVMVFVLFSCANPSSNDDGNSTISPSPEEPTYSITFTPKDPAEYEAGDWLNSFPDFKNLKEGTEVELPTSIYIVNIRPSEVDEWTLELTESSTHKVIIQYEDNKTSVVVGNEDIEIKYVVDKIIML